MGDFCSSCGSDDDDDDDDADADYYPGVTFFLVTSYTPVIRGVPAAFFVVGHRLRSSRLGVNSYSLGFLEELPFPLPFVHLSLTLSVTRAIGGSGRDDAISASPHISAPDHWPPHLRGSNPNSPRSAQVSAPTPIDSASVRPRGNPPDLGKGKKLPILCYHHRLF